MKKFSNLLAACLIIAVFLASSCHEEVDPPKPEYPMDIPFLQYFATCDMGFMGGCEANKVAIINSKKEFDSYHVCMSSEIYPFTFPDVDFSKYSLIYVKTQTRSNMDNIINRKLQQFSKNDYLWNIDYYYIQNDAQGAWVSIIMTKKIETNSNIYIHVDTLTNNDHWPYDEPVEIFTFDYSLPEICQWTNVLDNKVTIIRTDVQFQNHITCSDNIHLPYFGMLLTKVNVPKQIKTISKKLLYFGSASELHLDIELSDYNKPEERIISLLFLPPQWNSEYVQLKVNIINQ
jgi:hypothetical protein